jgi:hypothetical protein
MTQQNAALVKHLGQLTHGLERQSVGLIDAMRVFRIERQPRACA